MHINRAAPPGMINLSIKGGAFICHNNNIPLSPRYITYREPNTTVAIPAYLVKMAQDENEVRNRVQRFDDHF